MRRTVTIWRHVARIVVALFLIRAMIPGGFMPDLGAMHDGRLEIILCSVDGMKTITVNASGRATADDPLPGSKHSAGYDFCPLGSVTSQALALPTAVMASIGFHPAISDDLPSSDIHRLPPALGPPLGSRAPPTSLV